MAVLALALACGACTATSGQTTGSVAASPAAPSGRAATVAFESIDGPPESVYSRMVQSLTAEAEARQVAVVSRTTPAHYRVRVYTATVVYPKKSVIHWVWDVYDADQRRVFRLSGEEPVTGAGSNTWAAADEPVIRRMSSSGMDRLAGFLATPRPTPAPSAPGSAPGTPPPGDSGLTVAAYDAPSP
ncbi:MAG: hypothetical protein HXX10_22390 [Rhodoplanes sp.]|uniref:hypothetical protein n=1 Tax=Rhodoplanes sp. TaxID=1968906 RepID=UPI0017A8BB03|nr:hypothetical protein [Rhodoplanes sp.]NVO16783.1 hypothetical protein [Rhodoplanes sp.]